MLVTVSQDLWPEACAASVQGQSQDTCHKWTFVTIVSKTIEPLLSASDIDNLTSGRIVGRR